ncbi:lactate racemase domain-containing protein [Thermodesulfobacteriota bacterium]
MNFPDMALIKQSFDPSCISNIPAAIISEMERIGIPDKVKNGETVAITAGSRGIANIDIITRAVVHFLARIKAKPFIFPAMGSHGGATASGQKNLLARYGITEEAMGCPIISNMDVDEIGKTPDNIPVFIDRSAHSADHIIIINRIKPHTKFEGSIESGLMKMMVIGMGKNLGAKWYHKASVRLGMSRLIETIGYEVIENIPVLCGIGLVENGYDNTAIIKAVLPTDLAEEEKKLLIEAKHRLSRLPFSNIDLLIIDEMGKNISGTGMDTNVTGVNRDILGTFSYGPCTRRLFVRELTKESEGNATGIGLADFTTTRLVKKIDRKKTYINCLTGISPEKGAIPMYFDKDRECIEAAIHTLGMVSIEELLIVHIQNTLSLEKLNVSRAFMPEIQNKKSIEIIGRWQPLQFDNNGNLTSPF